MIESEKHIERRHRVMDKIAKRSNISAKVIEAMKRVPRQMFIASRLEDMAYDDRPLPIAAGQTISQIYTVAMQTNLLDLDEGASVLEIGTGCGYQTAVLCELGYLVYSIERHEELYLLAQQNLEVLGYNALLFHGDGFEGLPQYAPFDGVLITCGAPDVPEELIKQLAINGKMVAPIGRGLQEMMVIQKINEKENKITKEGAYRFVPMLPGIVDK
ncbi:MAG TPA: protein-L-isoaspartate(D-aspartate) O-methyltransferase [Dysgonamonadaceae bacterium]|nr:protein-L-isoaspartate(D-aspartate) O-methyltransferase [Dysgonamonadaceae bacterium]